MAEAPDIRNKPLEDLEREITCAVCHGHYERARLLPCNHYYCEACIEQLAKRLPDRPFDCPECRKETSLPAGGAAELQGAFFVERMKDVYCKMAQVEGKVDAVCEQCGEGEAVAFCRQCAEFICSICERSHKKMKAFSGHVLASLEDLKKGGVKSIPLKEAPSMKCAEHDQVMKLFCFDCCQLICGDCTFIDHCGHKFNFLKKCAPNVRKTLRESLTPLQRMQADITGAEKSLVTEEAKIDAQESDICRSIEQFFDKLKVILDQQKTELVKKAATIAREKRNALSVQKEGFNIAQTEIQLVMDLILNNIANTSDQDLMSIQTHLRAQIEEEQIHHQQRSLEPTAIAADISCSFPSCDVIPSDLGFVFDRSLSLQLLNSNIQCQVGSPMDVCVCAPTATLCNISAKLKCVANPSLSLQGDIVQKGAGIYSISLTPQVRGRHELTVRIKEEEIIGSPFRVFVTIPPLKLGQNVRKIGGVTYPWGIAINDKQQLVVPGGSSKQSVAIIDRDGKVVQKIEHSEFKHLRGVAIGPDGSIYVTDTDVPCICLLKCSREGTQIKTLMDNEVGMCYSVKIIKNQLYAVDYTKSIVKIFDKDCNYCGTIQIKECRGPGDIAEGPDGLYVACEKNICVYSPNGAFIRQLNLQPSTLKLSEFNGICFDSTGHIIATDLDNGVYIFNPNGECVRHIDTHFERPVGVVVDEDGFVYVCDYLTHEVVVL